MMNVINFLDGMDGLAGSVTIIAFLAIGFVSVLPQVNDVPTAIAAFAAASAIAGFLFYNFPPAKLILGTVGSWFIGFLIAILAIQGATKVATTAVVGAVPLIDALIVILGRLRRGNSPFRGDYTHLHHRLKRRGLSDQTILALYVVCSVILGLAAVVLQTHNKIILFLVFAVGLMIFVLVGSWVVRKKIRV
jgi:UDP-GlcNAc:undecaprenyl-phosphate GlcNAc-1-phosphate transferase